MKRLEGSGVGCHMGGHFTEALAYASDITDNRPLCLLPNKTLLSLTDPENQTIEILKLPSLKIIDKIDRSQSDLHNNQNKR